MHRSRRGHFRPSWSFLFVFFALVGLSAFVVSDALTDDKPQITGQAAGLEAPQATTAKTTPVALKGGPEPVTPIGPPPSRPQSAGIEAAAPDEAQWVNGNLVPPLPRDATLRRQALDQALATALARPQMGTSQLNYSTGVTDGPAGFASTEDPRSKVVPFVPEEVKRGERTFNYKLPDQFVAPPEALRGVDENGNVLAQLLRDDALTSALAPALKQTFDGISQTNLTPPDPDVSAGPEHVVAVVNARWAIYDKCGNNLYEENIATFVGNGVDFFFDPKVIYDVWDGVWYITCCVRNSGSQTSSVLLMRSDDSNPLGSWCWYYLPFQWDNPWWADYQDIGVSPDGIHITANMFNWANPASFQFSKLMNLDKAAVLACIGACFSDLSGMTNPADGTLAFTLRPCDMQTWPGELLLVNSVSYGGNFVTVWHLGGPVCAPTYFYGANVAVNAYDDPPPMIQPDGTLLDCGDARLLNASHAYDRIWAGHAIRYNWGEPDDRSIMQVFQIDPWTSTIAFQQAAGSPGLYFCYPAVDFAVDYGAGTIGTGVVAVAIGGPGLNPGSYYIDLGNGGPWGSLGLLAAGASSYNGSFDYPYRWGDYYGCDLDPFDWQTLWFYGQYTVDRFTWDTQVGAAAPAGVGVLSVTPFPGLVSGGFQGGPFWPGDVWYLLENVGASALTWTLSGVDYWNTATSFGGQIPAGSWQWVNVAINGWATLFTPGVYTDDYTFEDCYSNITAGRSTVLHVGVDGSCDGDKLELTPPDVVSGPFVDNFDVERGVFVTAIKNVVLCAVGYEMGLATLPANLEARVYAANGTTRGALLASNSIAAAQLYHFTHFVPLNVTLEECQDYEIVMVVPGGAAWYAWWEPVAEQPFDVGGAIRVRDGVANNQPNGLLPHFELITDRVAVPRLTDLAGPGAPPLPAGDDFQERGVYIHMLETAQLSLFGFEADLVAPQTLIARVYEAAGTVRGALIAEATYDVTLAGMRFHNVPINVQLEEGKDYDLAIEFGDNNNWQWWSELVIPTPFTKDVFQVVTSEYFGDPTNFALPHYQVGWDENTGGNKTDLNKYTDAFPPPYSTGQDFGQYGAYVTSVVSQQVYGVGWMADIPAGQPITATVYEAVGDARGVMISQGTVYSSGPGMRFHDVPVAVEMVAGVDYDISFNIPITNEWRFWDDRFGLPYTSGGVLTVRNSEESGDGGNFALIHMRMYGCDEVLTPVVDKPQRTPMFLAVPAPNPMSSSARLDFALEDDGPVSIVVYDVAGRRVTTLLEGTRAKGWNSVDINASNLASGVYFIKMQTKMKSLSRKFVVMH